MWWQTLLPHTSKTLQAVGVFLCRVCILSLCLSGFSPVTLFSSHSPNMQVMLIGNNKLCRGLLMWERMVFRLYVRPVIDLSVHVSHRLTPTPPWHSMEKRYGKWNWFSLCSPLHTLQTYRLNSECTSRWSNCNCTHISIFFWALLALKVPSTTRHHSSIYTHKQTDERGSKKRCQTSPFNLNAYTHR